MRVIVRNVTVTLPSVFSKAFQVEALDRKTIANKHLTPEFEIELINFIVLLIELINFIVLSS